MSKLMDSIREKAVTLNRRIVLPEGEESRNVHAAAEATRLKIAQVTLVGDEAKIRAQYPDVNLEGIRIVNPKTSEKLGEYAKLLYELRKAKGMTEEQAYETAQKPLFFGALMCKADDADGMVSGAVHTTGDVLRAALQVLKTAPGIRSASSVFIMTLPEGSEGAKYGQDGVLVYGDCGVIPNPTSEQLVDIAMSSVLTARKIAGIREPKVAFLSFSTKGSAKDPLVDKVQKAVELMKDANPDFPYDGELQGDAALVPKVAAQKAPGSPIGGMANVLIFPDLQAGNIAYKLTQRLAGAEAIGPLLQGIAKPVNDLSRGCDAEDIVSTIAITAVEAGL